MPFRFTMQERPTSCSDGPLFMSERTHASTVWTGLLLGKLASLLLRCRFQSAGQQAAHCSHGDFFHLVEIDIEARAILAPLLSHNDFSPTLCQFGDPLDIFFRQFAFRHVASV